MLIEMPLRSVRDRVLLVRSMPAFAALDDEALTLVAEHARTRAFRAGDTVLVEGEPVRAVYVLIRGQMTSTRKGRRVAVVRPPRGAGMLSVMARDEGGVHVVADEECLALEIPTSAVLHTLEENFSMLRNTLRVTASALVKKRGNLPAPPDRPPQLELGPWRDRPRTLVELILNVRGTPGIFARCNLDALVALARHIDEIRVEPGEVLWKIGEPSSSWLRIDHGHVRCTGADGRSVDVGYRFVLGIMDALGRVPRSYEARAETRVIAYRNELDPFLAVLENHFDLARDLLALLSKTLLETPEE